MRLGLVSPINIECGIATYTQHLAEYFPKDEVIIFGNKLEGANDLNDYKRHSIVRSFSRKGTHEELLKNIVDSNVDVIHFQHEFGLFQNHSSFVELLKVLKTHYNKKIIITFHTVFTEKKWNKKIYEYFEWSDRFIVHHESAANELNLGTNCFVIPHGSVTVKAKSKWESRDYFNIPQDKFVILSLGFITPTKSALDNISAVLRLVPKYPNLYLLIAGTSVVQDNNYANLEYALRLFQQVKIMRAEKSVKVLFKFIPEDELDYFAGVSDIAIENYKQTQYSTSGMSHLIMSYGLASISSNANILADLTEDRSLKYDIGNIEQMSQNLEKLITDSKLRKRLSENCLKYAEETSWKNTAKSHWELYKGIPIRSKC